MIMAALDDLKRLPDLFLTPAQVARVLKCRPYAINVQARQDPTRLGFPVCVTGTRVRIPREAFIRWVDGN